MPHPPFSQSNAAANALLKVIEEPGARTVWLLCAPTLTDVLPTIRSRCRHLTLRTPSVDAVTKLLIERDGIEPNMAELASSAAQGHIGRAKYLATNEEARKIREKILNIPSTVKDLASALEAANTLLDLAKKQTLSELEIRNEAEIVKLKEAYGSTGSRLETGGNKAIKELEKNLKSHSNRTINDYIYWALSEMTYKHDKRIAEHDELIKDLILSTSAFISVKFEFNTKLQLESYFIRKFYGITK